MNRRELLGALLTTAGVFQPFAVAGQRQAGMKRIGIIDDAPIWDNFRQRLSELGHVEGKTITFEYRIAEGDAERLSLAAKELVTAGVAVIAVYGSPAAKAAQAATDKVPIVAISIGDPVQIGLVKSLAHPDGNITGNTILGPDLVQKRLQLLKEMLPQASRVAFLWNPNNESNRAILEQLQDAAPKLGVTLISEPAGTAAEIDNVLLALASKHTDAVMTTNDPLHRLNMAKVIAFQFKQRVPGMFQIRAQVADGGLMSYGASLPALFRHGAGYAHRILQGTPPGDLPVEQPTAFDLAINLKTANALGLTVPPALLARADEVIE
jgi:ABC-type uncharacterized transport system substrate-binding protein